MPLCHEWHRGEESVSAHFGTTKPAASNTLFSCLPGSAVVSVLGP